MATSFKLNQQYLFYSEYTTILETIFFIEYIMDNITIFKNVFNCMTKNSWNILQNILLNNVFSLCFTE